MKKSEIKTASELGFKGTHRYILMTCPDCSREKWVRLINGTPRFSRCRHCAPMVKGQKETQRDSPLWKGGRITRSGYALVKLKRDDFFYPMANAGGYVLEHCLVVAKTLGRNLHRREIVHHKHVKYPAGSIEDKQDNRYPENLQLVTDDRHKQITILENRIELLEKRLTILEAENVVLKIAAGRY